MRSFIRWLETASAPQASSPPPVTIKKYANRRLYNTATSSYVTLEHLCQMVKDSVDFVVFDAKTGEDITRQVLTQIIVEEEGKGQNLLPISFMRKLIGFYGGNMQWALPTYLDQSMQSFSRNQEQMRDYFSKTVGGIFPFDAFSNMGKQNLAMMEQAMKMFAPFGGSGGRSRGGGRAANAPPAAGQRDSAICAAGWTSWSVKSAASARRRREEVRLEDEVWFFGRHSRGGRYTVGKYREQPGRRHHDRDGQFVEGEGGDQRIRRPD